MSKRPALAAMTAALLACADTPDSGEASSQGESNSDGMDAWCGAIDRQVHSAAEVEELLIPGWTVGEILALIEEVEIGVAWTSWSPDDFDPTPPAATTVLHLSPRTDGAELRGVVFERDDDEFCRDRVEVDLQVDLDTADGILAGTGQAELVFMPDVGAGSFYLAEESHVLGLDPLWPASEERPEPTKNVVRIELSSQASLSIDELAVGEVWLHRVWIDSRHQATEYTRLAVLGP